MAPIGTETDRGPADRRIVLTENPSAHVRALGPTQGAKATVPLVAVALAAVLLTACHTGPIVAALTPPDIQAKQEGRYADYAELLERKRHGGPLSLSEHLGLCEAYSRLKRYDRLERCLPGLEGRRWPLPMGLGEVDGSRVAALYRAEMYVELGMYRRAVDHARAALARASTDSDKLAPLQTLVLAHAFLKEHRTAREYLEAAERAYRSMPYPPLQLALARLYLAVGDYEASLRVTELLGRSHKWSPYGQGVQHDGAYIRAKSLLGLRRPGEAKAEYEALLKEPAMRHNREFLWVLLYELGDLEATGGNRDAAARYLRESVELIEQQRSTINSLVGRVGYVADKQRAYARLVAILLASGADGEALEYVERAKSRALVDLLAARKTFGGDPRLQDEIKALLVELEALELAEKAEASIGSAESTAQRTIAVTNARERLLRLPPGLASLVSVAPVRISDIQGALAADETLLEYFQSDGELYVFVVDRERVKGLRLDAPDVGRGIERFRHTLEAPGNTEHERYARDLYATLVEPVEPLIRTPKLVVVPHGVLHYLPFNALRSTSGFVIDRWSVRYLPSASAIRYIRAESQEPRRSVLALGNPDAGPAVPKLQHAEAEAVEIGGLFPRSKVLVGKEATETTFRRLAGEFGYLHIASHGRFDSESPLGSGLLLAPDSDNDGLLTVDELFGLQLGAEVVVLSACETGLGRLNPGDDMVGLSRGFMYAGARSVVASLWRVDDAATLALMREFYSNLGRLTPVEALRAAQVSVRGQYAHPFYWAAFQLTGAGH